MVITYKIDPVTHKVSPCKMGEMNWRGEERRVAETTVGKFWVSTVFLGINHNFRAGRPVLFETMIFAADMDEKYCDRYCTWDEAVRGHTKAVEIARKWIGEVGRSEKKQKTEASDFLHDPYPRRKFRFDLDKD